MTDLDFTAIGFEPMDAPWWPAIANALPRPWPREAVLFDLRWWRGQELATAKVGAKRRARMPGRPALCQRWGWSDWDARKVLASPDWLDQWTARPSSDSPASLQRPSSDSPADTRTNADYGAESSSDSPASLQRSSNDPPHARQITVPPDTDHRLEGGSRASDAPSPQEPPCPPTPRSSPCSAHALTPPAPSPAAATPTPARSARSDGTSPLRTTVTPTPARPPDAATLLTPPRSPSPAASARAPEGGSDGVTVAGRTLPPDLPALLTAGPGPDGREVEGLRLIGRAGIPWLVNSFGVADTASLLAIPADRWRLTGAKDAAPIATLRAFLRARWGVELGALAEVEPVRVRGADPRREAAEAAWRDGWWGPVLRGDHDDDWRRDHGEAYIAERHAEARAARDADGASVARGRADGAGYAEGAGTPSAGRGGGSTYDSRGSVLRVVTGGGA